MKIIIDADMIKEIFDVDRPTVPNVLKNKIIKNMTKNCYVTDVYQDDMDANNIGNLVIKVIPSLDKGSKNGK